MCIKKFDTVIKSPLGVSAIECHPVLSCQSNRPSSSTVTRETYEKPAAGCMREQVKMKRNFGLIHIPELEAICEAAC